MSLRSILNSKKKDEVTNIEIAFLVDQIDKLRTHIAMEKKGCKDPYKNYADNILLEPPLEENPSCYRGALTSNFGEGCYAQRVSCMDKTQNKNFSKIEKDFIKEDPNKNKWFVKLPIFDKKEKKFYGSYSLKNGDYYKVNQENISTSIRRTVKTTVFGKAKQESFRVPSYYLINKEGKPEELNLDKKISHLNKSFKRPRYPFFRPTDQCSVPYVNIQGVGGVCFQNACKQHDYCFQSLPSDLSITQLDHFNKCNNDFKNNIDLLCKANEKKGIWGSIKNRVCETGQRTFYNAVQSADAYTPPKFRHANSFYKSQNDQLNTLKQLTVT